jgi:quinol monooxygenase YgiN
MKQTKENNENIILINTFYVENENQQEILINELNKMSKYIISEFECISANLHKSLDGKRVINYVEWKSVEDWKNMLSDEYAKKHIEEVKKIVISYDPMLYKISNVHHK